MEKQLMCFGELFVVYTAVNILTTITVGLKFGI
jgi:hypothetical protein